jgi:hypothetical protein
MLEHGECSQLWDLSVQYWTTFCGLKAGVCGYANLGLPKRVLKSASTPEVQILINDPLETQELKLLNSTCWLVSSKDAVLYFI